MHDYGLTNKVKFSKDDETMQTYSLISHEKMFIPTYNKIKPACATTVVPNEGDTKLLSTSN